MGSWDTDRLYAIDPKTWRVVEDVAAPGKPYGIAAFGDGLRVVVSIGEEDDRFFYQFVPGQGFDPESKTACPVSNPVLAPVAVIPFDARGLAFDGDVWWTSHREASEIVSFLA